MLAEIMGKFHLPLLADGPEAIKFQLEQSRYFYEKMRAHEATFKKAYSKQDERAIRKQHERYIFNFAAFLNASRVAVYFLVARCRRTAEGKPWVEQRIRAQPFRAFIALRDANTHRRPLHFSLTFDTYADVEVPLQGVMPSRINVNLMDHLKVSHPPVIAVDVGHVDSPHRNELALFVRQDGRRQSLTFMCGVFIEELEAALAISTNAGYL